MFLRLVGLLFISLTVAQAQPNSALKELMYPVNPPRMVFPSRGGTTGIPVAPVHPLDSKTPSSDAFLRAYKKYKQGERLKALHKKDEAIECFAEVLSEMIALQKSDKDYQPRVVSYRLKKALEQLDDLLSGEER